MGQRPTFRQGVSKHALSELVSLRWDQVDLGQGMLHVRRRENGIPSTHPLRGPDLRALRQLERRNKKTSPCVFISERKVTVRHTLATKMQSASPVIYDCPAAF